MPEITKIQQRRGTAAAWTTANPVLGDGVLGVESDTLKVKIGNGVSTWTGLEYAYQAELDGKSAVGHTHTAAQISDSTATGRSVLTAASAAAARTAIGASDLVIGTTGTTAMAGNKTFSFAEITGLIGTAQLPPLAINDTFVVATQAAMLALTAQRGDIAIRTDTSETYVLSTDSPATLADWKEIISHGNVTSVAGRQGAVVLTKADVGLSNVDNTADSAKPVSTAQQTALNAKENSLPAGGTTAHYLRGDKTWQNNDKASVGLGNVDNTSDASKPVSTAQQTALNLKANAANPAFTGTPTGITKAHVGLGSVDNTADSAKPVSTAQQAALDAKAPLASPAFTGTPTGITKAHVGLANVDNTSDANKPISTAVSTALAGKANTSHTHTSADIAVIDGGTP